VTLAAGNLLDNLPATGTEQTITALLTTPHVRNERNETHAHARPPGFWYDPEAAEWVVVVTGAAGLHIDGEAEPRRLGPGDYLLIPAHVRHRVAWTAADQPTVWLAVHLPESP
jgi:cupin 2 domain-containing protein